VGVFGSLGEIVSVKWFQFFLPKLICEIPGIVDKQLQTSAERKSIAVKYITDNFPRAQWTHTYTDGSAKAEAAALVHAAKALREHISDAIDKVVIFTDALSVVTALKRHRPTDLGDLIDQLEGLTKSYQKVVIQWVPAHCDIEGNERADKLVKKGGALQQEDTGLTYDVVKSYIKCHLSSKWKKDHPSHQKDDAFHQLPRHGQVTILRLRT
jgi:ribonuclease HI